MGRVPILRGRTTASAIAAVVVVATIWAPSRVEAQPTQEVGEGGEMEASAAVIEIDVDVAVADPATIGMTLEELAANVSAHLTNLQNARSAVATAEAEVVAANDAVAATQAEIDHWVAESDQVVVEAFVTPPMLGAADMISSETVKDVTVKHAVLDMESDSAADALASLDDARNRLEDQKDAQEVAVDDAEARRRDAEAALAGLEAAAGQQASFIALVEERLDHELSEAAGIANIDPAMAAELQARQVELLAQLQAIRDSEAFEAAMEELARAEEEARNNPPPVMPGPPSGSLATVTCPAGLGSITVDSSLQNSLAALLSAAEADGIILCGDGYRSYEMQVAVREANCGSGTYNIYEKPASQCNPPTARPGTSQHEVGLAVDFTCNGGGVIPSRSSPCFQWMDDNAGNYGLINLPSEPWHFSTTGD